MPAKEGPANLPAHYRGPPGNDVSKLPMEGDLLRISTVAYSAFTRADPNFLLRQPWENLGTINLGHTDMSMVEASAALLPLVGVPVRVLVADSLCKPKHCNALAIHAHGQLAERDDVKCELVLRDLIEPAKTIQLRFTGLKGRDAYHFYMKEVDVGCEVLAQWVELVFQLPDPQSAEPRRVCGVFCFVALHVF